MVRESSVDKGIFGSFQGQQVAGIDIKVQFAARSIVVGSLPVPGFRGKSRYAYVTTIAPPNPGRPDPHPPVLYGVNDDNNSELPFPTNRKDVKSAPE